VIQPQHLDFGEREVARAFVWKAPLEVLSMNTSCGCTKVAPEAFTLPPRGTQELEFTLDLAPTREADLNRAYTNFSVELTPVVRGGLPEPVSFRLTGRVFAPCEVEPPYLSFGGEYIAGEPPPAREVTVRSRRPAQSLSAVCERRTVNIDVEQIDGAFRLKIVPKADLPAGKHEFRITLSGVSPEGRPLPLGYLPAVVDVLAPVAASPPFVPFGLLTIGQSEERELSLRSRTPRPFEVVEVRVPDDFGLTVTRGDAGDRFTLAQRAVALGSQRQTVTFVVRVGGDDEPVELPVQVAYQGLAPAVAADSSDRSAFAREGTP
jgi:hypothetical protein